MWTRILEHKNKRQQFEVTESKTSNQWLRETRLEFQIELKQDKGFNQLLKWKMVTAGCAFSTYFIHLGLKMILKQNEISEKSQKWLYIFSIKFSSEFLQSIHLYINLEHPFEKMKQNLEKVLLTNETNIVGCRSFSKNETKGQSNQLTYSKL